MVERSARTRFIAAPLAAAALVLGAGPALAVPAPRVLLGDLSSPKGLTVDGRGNPIVGQGAFGPPGPVLAYVLHGKGHGSTVPLTDPIGLVDVAAADDGSGYGLTNDGVLLRRAADGTITPLLDVVAYEHAHPDPYNNNPDDPADESNPYGLATLRNGDALVADAANNSIVRVTPTGAARTIARFTLMPGGQEAVPTSIARGPNGDILVGQLVGFPFLTGNANVWRIDPASHEVLCSVAAPQPGCSVYASGFTAINDLAYDARNHSLYVYELAAGGVEPFEEGLGTGQFPPAVLLKVHNGKRTELAKGRLSQPGGVAVGKDSGHVLVTDSVFTGGRLLEVTR